MKHFSCPQGIDERRQRLTGLPDKTGCIICSKREMQGKSLGESRERVAMLYHKYLERCMQRMGLGVLLQLLIRKKEVLFGGGACL